jgi:hypothetical protein
MLKSLNSSFDLVTPREMADAMTRYGGVANALVMLSTITPKEFTGPFRELANVISGRKKKNPSQPKKRIKDITSFADFEFTNEGVIVRKQSSIGCGKLIPLEDVALTMKSTSEIILPEGYDDVPPESSMELTGYTQNQIKKKTQVIYKRAGQKVTEDAHSDEEDEPDDDMEDPNNDDSVEEIQQGFLFRCPNQLCTATFRRARFLESHKMNGVCHFKKTTTSILKHVQRIYFNQFGTEESVEKMTSAQRRNLKTHIGSLGESTVPNLPRLQSKVNEHSRQGWALFKRKKAVAFSSKIKGFLWQIFLEGERTNNTIKPHVALQRMRNATTNNTLTFTIEEWLTEEQIKGLFCRWDRQNKLTTGGQLPASASASASTSALDDAELEDGDVDAPQPIDDALQEAVEQDGIYDRMQEIPDVESQQHPIYVSIAN